ncbi:hypothetical protein CMI45_01715 [Candidatus Pacearchaeota archaeon]|nr:hypothetical protein [Candidatus Pacearchaeota archaeon]|tara:strand:- start:114 stop:668 length:555 start_codon:yes stop_codon:yes gene_type:complete
MKTIEKSMLEISEKLKGMGDYVKISYLRDCLNNNLNFETRKFVLVRLAGIYEERSMFGDAAKLYRFASEINTSTESRINDFVKSTELFIRAGMFDEADASYRKALSLAKEIEKNKIVESVKGFYKTQGKLHEANDKRRNAMIIYEKLKSSFDLDMEEKKFVRERLLFLYDKLGKIKEYLALKEK